MSPDYTEEDDGAATWECDMCGALVQYTELHNEWHARLERRHEAE